MGRGRFLIVLLAASRSSAGHSEYDLSAATLLADAKYDAALNRVRLRGSGSVEWSEPSSKLSIRGTCRFGLSYMVHRCLDVPIELEFVLATKDQARTVQVGLACSQVQALIQLALSERMDVKSVRITRLDTGIDDGLDLLGLHVECHTELTTQTRLLLLNSNDQQQLTVSDDPETGMRRVRADGLVSAILSVEAEMGGHPHPGLLSFPPELDELSVSETTDTILALEIAAQSPVRWLDFARMLVDVGRVPPLWVHMSAASGPADRPQLMTEVASFLANAAPLRDLPPELLVAMRTAASHPWPRETHPHPSQAMPTSAYGWASQIDHARASEPAGLLSVGGWLRSVADEETVLWAERQCRLGEPCWRTVFREVRFVRQPDRSGVRVTYVELMRSLQPVRSSLVPPLAIAVLAIGHSRLQALSDGPVGMRAAAGGRAAPTEHWAVRASVGLAARHAVPRVYFGGTPCDTAADELGRLLHVEVSLRGDGFHRTLVTRAHAPGGSTVDGRRLNRTALAGCTLMQLVLVPASV